MWYSSVGMGFVPPIGQLAGLWPWTPDPETCSDFETESRRYCRGCAPCSVFAAPLYQVVCPRPLWCKASEWSHSKAPLQHVNGGPHHRHHVWKESGWVHNLRGLQHPPRCWVCGCGATWSAWAAKDCLWAPLTWPVQRSAVSEGDHSWQKDWVL